MSEESPSSVRIEKCEKHGLRYNAAKDWGCVRCRKEAGEKIGGGGRSASPPAAGVAAVAAAGSGGAMGPALGMTVLLLFAAAGGIYWGHSVAYEAAASAFTGAPDQEMTEGDQQFEQLMQELGADEEYGEYEEYDEYDN